MFATEFAKLRATIHTVLDEFGAALSTFFGAAFQAIEKNGGPVLIALAEQAVLSAETSGGTGSQKLQLATDIIVAGLKDKGIPIVTNAVNLAIEATVAKLQAGQLAPGS